MNAFLNDVNAWLWPALAAVVAYYLGVWRGTKCERRRWARAVGRDFLGLAKARLFEIWRRKDAERAERSGERAGKIRPDNEHRLH